VTRIRVDPALALHEQPGTGHNRWHPGVEPIARAAPGEEITLELRDGLDAQLGPTSTAADLGAVRFGRSHPLTGPVFVEGAEPGDLLELEILGYEHADWGITAFLPGFGFLADVFEEPYLVVWDLTGGMARAPALPGVAIPADLFAGVLGLAPSQASLDRSRAREEELRARGGLVAGEDSADAWPHEAATGLRTIPPRETGGNLDIRQLVAGSKLFLPVEVEGALFSAGDLHFAQGDGEVCGSAIEISGAVTVRFGLRKQPAWLPRFAAFEAPASLQRASYAATGIPLADDGANMALDLNVAARRALLELIDYLQHVRGLTREAAYILCSVAADLRVSEVVDAPNAVVSALLPLDVFEDAELS
jgi:formamidase